MTLRLHPRTKIVVKASMKLSEFLDTFVEEFELTYGEVFSMLGQEIAKWAKFMIRDERHPKNPTKGGDET